MTNLETLGAQPGNPGNPGCNLENLETLGAQPGSATWKTLEKPWVRNLEVCLI